MQIKILWVVLIVTNLSWFVALRIVDKGRMSEISDRQKAEQQRDFVRVRLASLPTR